MRKKRREKPAGEVMKMIPECLVLVKGAWSHCIKLIYLEVFYIASFDTWGFILSFFIAHIYLFIYKYIVYNISYSYRNININKMYYT